MLFNRILPKIQISIHAAREGGDFFGNIIF